MLIPSHSHLLIPSSAKPAITSGLHATNDVPSRVPGAPTAPAPRSRTMRFATPEEGELAMKNKRLTMQQRQELFHALVTFQDMGMSIPESRQQVGQQFEIGEEDIRKIEEEGIDKEWPPLNEVAHSAS
jgi:hypothetical protein